MPSRLMRYTQDWHGPLAQNPRHRFAQDHAIALYARNTVFSYIPKNGCSTLRYSAALENQVIDGPEGVRWIHNNNSSFRPTHAELVNATYTFAVLRCPFRRLASCFLHAIVRGAWDARFLHSRAMAKHLRLHRLENLIQRLARSATLARLSSTDTTTFADFVSLLESPGALRLDIRWRPQTDFLVYRTYDDLFRLEEMDHLSATVQAKSGFVVQDARRLTRHGNDGREPIHDGFFGRTEAVTLRQLKAEMKVPAYERLYDADLYRRVSQLYHGDVALYAEQFGQSALMQLP